MTPFAGAAEDGLPVQDEWHGLISCAASAAGLVFYPCAQDPNHAVDGEATAAPGLQRIVAELAWETAAVGAEELQFRVSYEGGQADASGASPLVIEIEDGGWDGGAPVDFAFRVDIPRAAGIVVQQEFTVTYTLHSA